MCMLNRYSGFLNCNMSVKVKASGSGTLTTIAWMAPLTPPPGRSGLKSLTTPVTRGNICLLLTAQKMSLFPLSMHVYSVNLNGSIVHF